MTAQSLDSVGRGTPVRVVSVDGAAPTARRLAEMGVRPGADVEVLFTTSGGGRVLGVNGARVAVDSTTAGQITARVVGVE